MGRMVWVVNMHDDVVNMHDGGHMHDCRNHNSTAILLVHISHTHTCSTNVLHTHTSTTPPAGMSIQSSSKYTSGRGKASSTSLSKSSCVMG